MEVGERLSLAPMMGGLEGGWRVEGGGYLFGWRLERVVGGGWRCQGWNQAWTTFENGGRVWLQIKSQGGGWNVPWVEDFFSGGGWRRITPWAEGGGTVGGGTLLEGDNGLQRRCRSPLHLLR